MADHLQQGTAAQSQLLQPANMLGLAMNLPNAGSLPGTQRAEWDHVVHGNTGKMPGYRMKNRVRTNQNADGTETDSQSLSPILANFPNMFNGQSSKSCQLLVCTYNVHMEKLRFEWDARKDRANTGKHGVTFEEARTAFYDEYAIQFYDPDHSEEEARFILLGMSFKLRTLVVCHCFRKAETVVRLISARKASSPEVQEYWRRRK